MILLDKKKSIHEGENFFSSMQIFKALRWRIRSSVFSDIFKYLAFVQTLPNDLSITCHDNVDVPANLDHFGKYL